MKFLNKALPFMQWCQGKAGKGNSCIDEGGFLVLCM